MRVAVEKITCKPAVPFKSSARKPKTAEMALSGLPGL
jgi:hypothetical protein